MSQLTLQEQYKKFYDKPHLWIDAIEVEFIESFYKFKRGEVVRFTSSCYSIIAQQENRWCVPKFKPQEGDQFIKDLEDAVRLGCYGEAVTKNFETKWDWTFTLNLDEEAHITIVKAGLDISLSHGVTFNSAAYVDRMRELGYYL